MLEIIFLIAALIMLLFNLILWQKYDKLKERNEIIKALIFNEMYKSKKSNEDFKEFLKNTDLESEYAQYISSREKYGVYFL